MTKVHISICIWKSFQIDKEIHAFVISIWGDFFQCIYIGSLWTYLTQISKQFNPPEQHTYCIFMHFLYYTNSSNNNSSKNTETRTNSFVKRKTLK